MIFIEVWDFGFIVMLLTIIGMDKNIPNALSLRQIPTNLRHKQCQFEVL